MSQRTFRVIRNKRNPPGSLTRSTDITEATGLPYPEAKALAAELAREEQEAKPLQTSWTRDIFLCERERAGGEQ